eukprot:1845227-Pleurochrysis_carterae.AAC.1
MAASSIRSGDLRIVRGEMKRDPEIAASSARIAISRASSTVADEAAHGLGAPDEVVAELATMALAAPLLLSPTLCLSLLSFLSFL